MTEAKNTDYQVVAIDPDGNDVSDRTTLGPYAGQTWPDRAGAVAACVAVTEESDALGIGPLTFRVGEVRS